jgi:hypothetical protein
LYGLKLEYWPSIDRTDRSQWFRSAIIVSLSLWVENGRRDTRLRERFRLIGSHPMSAQMSDKPVAERLQVKGERRLAVVDASSAVNNMQ